MESPDVRPKLAVDTFQFSGAGRLFAEILLDRVELLQSAMVILALPVECVWDIICAAENLVVGLHPISVGL
jgi:hypothetical protein